MAKNNKDKNVVFLVPHAPPIDFLSKFFVHELIASGFHIAYWNIGPVIGYDLRVNSLLADGVIDCKLIYNKQQFQDLLDQRSHSNTVFVPQITPSFESMVIFRLIARAGVKTVFFGRGYLPSVSESKQQRFYLLKRLIHSQSRLVLLREILRRAWFRLQPKVKPLDIVFTAGRLAGRIHAQDGLSIIRIHHFDIDRVLKAGYSISHEYKNYCVFLDDYLPFHPDFVINSSPTIDPQIYFTRLNKLFNWVEQAMQCKVVIASHPKADYLHNPFEGRAIVSYQTHNLVSDARFVLAHASTAISFAVIFHKPLCLIYCDQIRSIHYPLYASMKKTSEILGCDLINFTQPQLYSSINLNMSVDQHKYDNYRREYLSDVNDPRPSSKIVISAIENMLIEASPSKLR